MNVQVQQCLRLEPNQPATVLDVGCGIGASCRQMASLLPLAKFIGVNISQKQVEFGQKLIAENALVERIQFLQNDFTKINLEADSIDAAYAIESACYDKGFAKIGFINEMGRLLKSGGTLVVADGFRKHSKPLPMWLEKWHRRNLDFWSMDELADIQLFTKKMETAGFEIVEVKDISWQVAPSALHLPITAIKIYLKRFFKKIGESQHAKLSEHQKNYPKAIWLTLFLGLFRKYFGYYLVVGRKMN